MSVVFAVLLAFPGFRLFHGFDRFRGQLCTLNPNQNTVQRACIVMDLQ